MWFTQARYSGWLTTDVRNKNMFVNGYKLICPHCKGESFEYQEIMLNTTGMTLLNLDWLNNNADTFFCLSCRRIEWFVDARVSHDTTTEN